MNNRYVVNKRAQFVLNSMLDWQPVKIIGSGELVDVIYLDFKKAFDKVSHMRLIAWLKQIGVKGKLLDWIREWLNRNEEW